MALDSLFRQLMQYKIQKYLEDEGGVSSGSESGTPAVVVPTSGSAAGGVSAGGGNMMIGGVRAPVPTISVTPHSPGILDEPLEQLQRIQQAVQRMRHQPYTPQHTSQCARLSTSCPALNKDEDGADGVMLEDGDGCTSPATPSHHILPSHDYPGSRKGSVGDGRCWLSWRVESEIGEISRRRSWTGLEDLSSRHKLTQDRNRQRSSMSLSSMESECDDVDNSVSSGRGGPRRGGKGGGAGGGGGASGSTTPSGRRRGGRYSAAQSTHSLNEADLQKDFQKIVALREAETSRLAPRLPLQKSISTPSIVALPHEAPPAAPLLQTSGAQTESETEEEPSVVNARRDPHIQTVYDPHAEKRRKRGSLFFRKKKDKSKKVSHQWVSACYGHSHACDWCSKPLTNKPALYCENCLTTVHQNACKDNILDCNKPKTIKNALAKSSSSISSKNVPKRASLPSHAQNNSGGSGSQLINDEKDSDHHKDGCNVSDDTYSASSDWSEANLTAEDLGADPLLGLGVDEPESWSPGVPRELVRSLKEKEVKRQEHIYEFIMTEKHHCLTLRVMQKMFADGLQRHFRLGAGVERMFPRLYSLWQAHSAFLGRLRARQKEGPVVTTIADILLQQFSGHNAQTLKSAYGEFCSRHHDAVEVYKECAAREPRLPQFIRRCQGNPLLRKKGVPECVLFVAQRLTKYPLLIEPLIKAARDNRHEQETLHKALSRVKEILVSVNGQVAEKEKEDRKLEIYHRIDAKSYTTHRGEKFKKSDILQGNRSLRFEGLATLMQGRGKMQMVLVIVLSDCLFFLQDNNNKYSFFTPDNKTGVVSLQKLLVREKAGAESRGLYLISSNPAEPEMFELKVHKPKDKAHWIQAIRNAVQTCPEEEDENNMALSAEERQRILEFKQENIRQITGLLREKDVEYALLLEEKMSLQSKLLAASGINPHPPLPPPHYTALLCDTHTVWTHVCQAIKEVSVLTSTLYGSGTNLSRSISSAGERQSSAYVSPTLPRRAETFGGFDNQHGKANTKKSDQTDSSSVTDSTPVDRRSSSSNNNNTGPGSAYDPAMNLDWELLRNRLSEHIGIPSSLLLPPAEPPPASPAPTTDQQVAAMRLSHYVYTLMCIIWQQLTTIHSLEAQLSACKMGGEVNKSFYKHNQQLEELRNLQDKLSEEKAAWAVQQEQEAKALCEKEEQLERLQRRLAEQQGDVEQQRERLYRRLESLAARGLLTDPALSSQDELAGGASHGHGTSSGSASSPLSETSPTDTHKRKDSKWKTQSTTSAKQQPLPIQLISAQNQQKIVQAQNLPIKQQLPLKLASKLSNNNNNHNPMVQSSNMGASANPVSLSNAMAQQGGHATMQGNQLLPLRLSQGSSLSNAGASAQQANDRRYSSGTSMATQGYQRLIDSDQSPVSSHSRTGSSPAMMGFSLPPAGQPQNKATRTNTYPKLPERFRVRTPDSPVQAVNLSPTLVHQSQSGSGSTASVDGSKQTTNQKEEEIIFF